MNLLLLGNGFDLYHKLPTKYDNFLHTVDFLIKHYNENMFTIGDVFQHDKLQNQDAFITFCYNQHKDAYDSVLLDSHTIKRIREIGKNNIWFRYFINTFNKDVGLIDFEKEISFVVLNFKNFLNKINLKVRMTNLPLAERFVIEQFNFFFIPASDIGYYSHNWDEKYVYEYPLGSGQKVVNKELIIKELNEQIKDFAKMLKLYMKCFVEDSLEYIVKETNFNRCKAITHIDKTITFNYTNTYEKAYSKNSTCHIHGNVDSKIILGINPDSSDNLETIDTDFVCFKKYYQRMQFDTDLDYISFVKTLNNTMSRYSLIVMGHSLDETDKDIIIELFRKMNEITILYHDENAKLSYMSNLLKIFGKEELDDIRKRKNLRFISLDSDLTRLAEDMANRRYADALSYAIKRLNSSKKTN